MSIQAYEEEGEAAAGVCQDDGADHAIDYITGSQPYALRRTSVSPTASLSLSPLPLSQSRRVYVSASAPVLRACCRCKALTAAVGPVEEEGWVLERFHCVRQCLIRGFVLCFELCLQL